MSHSIRAILVIALLVASACGGGTEEAESNDGGSTPAETDLAAIEAAAKEEGTVVVYSVTDPEKFVDIGPVFEERYPEVDIQHIQATGEELLQRLLAEGDAGRVIADVVELNGFEFFNAISVDLVEAWQPPEAEAYPDSLKDPSGLWTASSIGTDIVAWNTDLVSPDEEPETYDDLTDPRWKGRLLVERDDIEMFAALADGKFGSVEGASTWLEDIAANDPEVHSGHTATLDLLAAGQGAVFLGALGDMVQALKDQGAPVEWMKTEGTQILSVAGLVQGGPNPNAARLFLNWLLSEEGQEAYAQVEIPARPGVELGAPLLPDGMEWYPSSPDAAEDQNEIADVWFSTLGLQR